VKPFLQPSHKVAILIGWTLSRGAVPSNESLIGSGQFVNQNAGGPVVIDKMMGRQLQDVIIRARRSNCPRSNGPRARSNGMHGLFERELLRSRIAG